MDIDYRLGERAIDGWTRRTVAAGCLLLVVCHCRFFIVGLRRGLLDCVQNGSLRNA
jgi:hypothetical protein